MLSSKTIELYKDFAAGVYLSEAPLPFLGFCLGWSSNFVGTEYGQIQSVTPAEYGLQQDSTPPTPSHTLSVYTVL